MKTRVLNTLFLLIIASPIFAQPGGGGGLNISYFVHFYGDTLSLSDTDLKINHYVMNKKCTVKKFQFSENQKNKHYYFTGQPKSFYLPPDYNHQNLALCPNQRLEIIYRKDTMTIDFVGVMKENGIGRTEQLDCIRYFPGYYKMHLTESERFDSIWNLRDQFPDQIRKLQEDMRKGIVLNTMTNLKGWKIVEEANNPNRDIILLRYNREHCEETGQAVFNNNATRLCEGMMTLQKTHLYLNTIQKGSIIDDTLTLSYYYYYVFDCLIRPVVPAYGKSDPNYQHPPAEETMLAQTYLEALENLTLYVNGTRYTGKLIVFVNWNNWPGLFSKSRIEEGHYYYENGKLSYKYIPIRAEPAFNDWRD